MIAPETLTILSQLTGKPMPAREAETVFQTLDRQESYAPAAMVAGLIDALQIQYDNDSVSTVEPVFSDILARDRHTGYYIHAALRTLYLDFAITASGQPGQTGRNFLILGDYMNLSAVNEAIGRSTTNDVMATICGIYLDSMTRAGVVDWLYHRSMGDEVTFIILNTDEDKVVKGLDNAEKITREFIEALGLWQLRHKKYADRMGAGMVTARVTLSPDTDHRMLKQRLDNDIQVAKKMQPSPRNWFGLAKSGVNPDQFHNRASEARVDKALHKYRHYRNAAQFAAEAEQKTSTRNALNPARSLLVGRAIAWPRDDRIEYLRNHHDNSRILLRADIYNLGGLNAVFGHDGADQVKAHMIRILHSAISSYAADDPQIFDCGGGIIDIALNALSGGHLHKLVQAIQNNIHYQILTHSVADYANAHNLSFSGSGETLLADLPHPRHENFGTGLIMATHLVEMTRSLPEIIERVDKITHRTKMHDFAYLWTDDSARVFGYLLNKAPEPVEIGPDRANPGSHYLPFTEALREYLKTEDLPDIFERPVGQICEMIFGTDMQAVLGFKKAIRLLQEKGVADDAIDTIGSYQEMDNRLRAAGLPPLSVVSTQNRPSISHTERESFKTMTLAEKLEGLTRPMTLLALQAQACFRTLKMMEPHGHLAPAFAAQILIEEMDLAPNPANVQADAAAAEALYYLARLSDRASAAINKDLPMELRRAFAEVVMETLKDLAQTFETVKEPILAQKIRSFVWDRAEQPCDRAACIALIDNGITGILEKIERKNLLDTAQFAALQDHLESLLNILRTHARSDTPSWVVSS